MCELCQKDSKIGRKVKQEIKSLVHRLLRKYTIDRIILFGSFSRGDFHNWSDIDMIVVGDFKERFFDRIGLVLNEHKGVHVLEPLVYTPEEFARMKKEKRPFIQEILKTGILLYKRGRKKRFYEQE